MNTPTKKKKHRRPPIKNYKRLPQKWERWLKAVQDDIIHLRHLQEVFTEFRKIYHSNPRLKKYSVFYDFVSEAYANTVSIGIRRVVDRDPRSLSMIKLMWEIYDNVILLTRGRYVRLYKLRDKIYKIRFANRDYDKAVGKGLKCLKKSIVKKDIAVLKRNSNLQLVCRYANKIVAHRNIRAIRKIPTFNNLHNALDVVETIIKRYSLLLFAQGWIDMKPTIQEGWKIIFEEPWIIKK